MVNRFERFSYAISEISRYWHKITNDEMEKYGLKGAHSVYLLALYNCPEGLTAPKICEISGKDKADVSRMMNIMEEKGMVRKEGETPRLYRGVFVLTEKGRAAAGQVRQRAALAVELAGKDLTDANREIFYNALENIAVNLREISRNGLPADTEPKTEG